MDSTPLDTTAASQGFFKYGAPVQSTHAATGQEASADSGHGSSALGASTGEIACTFDVAVGSAPADRGLVTTVEISRDRAAGEAARAARSRSDFEANRRRDREHLAYLEQHAFPAFVARLRASEAPRPACSPEQAERNGNASWVDRKAHRQLQAGRTGAAMELYEQAQDIRLGRDS